MTNKINGIDVSECVFFKERYTRIGDDVDNDISFENHCMLSECTFSIGNCEKINCYFKQLQRLKQKNEKLKEKVNSYNCNADCYKYKEADKYRQALEEIREITNEYITYCMGSKCEGMEEIQNKIDEVLK